MVPREERVTERREAVETRDYTDLLFQLMDNQEKIFEQQVNLENTLRTGSRGVAETIFKNSQKIKLA